MALPGWRPLSHRPVPRVLHAGADIWRAIVWSIVPAYVAGHCAPGIEGNGARRGGIDAPTGHRCPVSCHTASCSQPHGAIEVEDAAADTATSRIVILLHRVATDLRTCLRLEFAGADIDAATNVGGAVSDCHPLEGQVPTGQDSPPKLWSAFPRVIVRSWRSRLSARYRSPMLHRARCAGVALGLTPPAPRSIVAASSVRANSARGNREPGANPGLSRSGEWERPPAPGTDPQGSGSAGQ